MLEWARSVCCTNLWRGGEKRGSKRKEKEEEEEGKACLLHCAEVRNNRVKKISQKNKKKFYFKLH